MNQLELQTKRNNSARVCRHTSKIHRNCIRINTNSTYEHEKKKFDECWRLAKEGKAYITEAEGEDKSWRADILVLDDNLAIEIVKSETDESIQIKNRKYPMPIFIMKI